jgi:DNA repair protein RadC
MITECDSPELEIQIPLFDLTEGASSPPRKRNRVVDKTLAQLRLLHDQLNTQLYAHPTERPVVNSPQDAANLVIPFIGNLDHEELWVILLDTRNRVKCLVALYKGSVNTSQVRVAEVFRQAITDNALAIIIAHNHPSGDIQPSPDDIGLTRAIAQAGHLLDILLLDHIIVSGTSAPSFISLKERGLLALANN